MMPWTVQQSSAHAGKLPCSVDPSQCVSWAGKVQRRPCTEASVLQGTASQSFAQPAAAPSAGATAREPSTAAAGYAAAPAAPSVPAEQPPPAADMLPAAAPASVPVAAGASAALAPHSSHGPGTSLGQGDAALNVRPAASGTAGPAAGLPPSQLEGPGPARYAERAREPAEAPAQAVTARKARATYQPEGASSRAAGPASTGRPANAALLESPAAAHVLAGQGEPVVRACRRPPCSCAASDHPAASPAHVARTM